MFNRARADAPRPGRTEQAVTLLENVVKVYKGTKTAAEAKEALDRPGQNLPLFLDRPTVRPPSRRTVPRPEPAPAPPAVVTSSPSRPRATPP